MEESFGTVAPSHPLFKVVTASDSAKTLKSASPIAPKNVIPSSGVIRPLLLTKTDEATLAHMRSERKIDENTATVLFMGGGAGQSVDFPEELAANMDVQNKLHLIVIAGGNKQFGDHFEELAKKGILTKEGSFYKGKNPNVTIEVAKDPGTKTKDAPYYIGEAAINRYFDLADVLYTKPGGSTTMEALAKGLTILFDSRKGLMSWEEDNKLQAMELGNLQNSSNADFVDDLMHAIGISKSREKKPRDLPGIQEVIEKRLEEVRTVTPWQQAKFKRYRSN
jgi:UDP-N-acetylglucosamine:LPS N-acetylglucosamine transferase